MVRVLSLSLCFCVSCECFFTQTSVFYVCTGMLNAHAHLRACVLVCVCLRVYVCVCVCVCARARASARASREFASVSLPVSSARTYIGYLGFYFSNIHSIKLCL